MIVLLNHRYGLFLSVVLIHHSCNIKTKYANLKPLHYDATSNSFFQIRRICENDCIGFDVTNTGRDTLVIKKASQAVACLSVWATVKM